MYSFHGNGEDEKKEIKSRAEKNQRNEKEENEKKNITNLNYKCNIQFKKKPQHLRTTRVKEREKEMKRCYEI